MAEARLLDDPIWPVVLEQRLRPYVDAVRIWWANIEDLSVNDTGIYVYGDLPGLYYRFTRVPARSPIKGIQAFPFVQAAYLQITGVSGGSVKMIDRVCLNNKFTIDEFTIVCKSNLPSTIQQGQILAFIPTVMLDDAAYVGKWIYMTPAELQKLANGIVTDALRMKAILKL